MSLDRKLRSALVTTFRIAREKVDIQGAHDLWVLVVSRGVLESGTLRRYIFLVYVYRGLALLYTCHGNTAYWYGTEEFLLGKYIMPSSLMTYTYEDIFHL